MPGCLDQLPLCKGTERSSELQVSYTQLYSCTKPDLCTFVPSLSGFSV